jgi:hypothetical protein
MTAQESWEELWPKKTPDPLNRTQDNQTDQLPVTNQALPS